MSFILDALKKSETDRQQQGSSEFAGVPKGSGKAGVPRWLWALGLLLVINLAVLLGLLLRPSTEAPGMPLPSIVETRAPALGEPSFADQVASAKLAVPAGREPAVAVAQDSQTPPTAEADVVSSVATRQPSAILPTIHEVRANGTVVLPDLHLDIHVYSDVPEDRFVFINMSKQREASQLTEGPVVEEITPDGVVLEYRGTSFLLPRE
ncbi:MAG: general secretion pathway protein GspB [Gammaproteobacteria bacterium]|nr:general secretion pathway protein GspB [Gammaproteobacteria bacterium]